MEDAMYKIAKFSASTRPKSMLKTVGAQAKKVTYIAKNVVGLENASYKPQAQIVG